eukprot:jgi/Psemu1/30435/gm1.30435_g
MDNATTKKRGHCQSEVLPVLDTIFVMAPPLSKPQPDPANGGCKNGTSNYTKAEVMNMLNCMKKGLPISPDQWEHIAQLYTDNYPHSAREKLHQKSIPTGDPNIPDGIALAKEIECLIGRKADLGDGEEEFDLEQGYTVNEDTNCNNNNNNNCIPPSQLTSFSSVKSPTLVGESVIAEAPLSSAKSKKAKKKMSYKRKATSDDVLAAFHLSFEQQESNAVRARQEPQEAMSSILSLARAYFSSCNNNSNAKLTHDKSKNPMQSIQQTSTVMSSYVAVLDYGVQHILCISTSLAAWPGNCTQGYKVHHDLPVSKFLQGKLVFEPWKGSLNHPHPPFRQLIWTHLGGTTEKLLACQLECQVINNLCTILLVHALQLLDANPDPPIRGKRKDTVDECECFPSISISRSPYMFFTYERVLISNGFNVNLHFFSGWNSNHGKSKRQRGSSGNRFTSYTKRTLTQACCGCLPSSSFRFA